MKVNDNFKIIPGDRETINNNTITDEMKQQYLKKENYIIGVDILRDYPRIIPTPEGIQPKNPTVDLEDAHLIITTETLRELAEEDKNSPALIRLKNLFQTSRTTEWGHAVDIHSVANLNIKEQRISIVRTDGDDYYFDGLMSVVKLLQWSNSILFLTNDASTVIRSHCRHVKTRGYSYELPKIYTGRRDITIPNDLFVKFWNEKYLSRAEFEASLPEQRRLITNEFVVMTPADLDELNPVLAHEYYDDPYFRNIGRYDADQDALVPLQYVSKFQANISNPGQAMYAEALLDPQFSAVVCTGPAGSGKTYMASTCGYIACTEGEYLGVTVIPCEDRSNIGALPGDLDAKMNPSVQPIKNALRNFLLQRPDYQKKLANLRKYGTNSDAFGKNNQNDQDFDQPQERNSRKNRRKAKNVKTNVSFDPDGNGTESRLDKNCSIKKQATDHTELIYNNWFSNVPVALARGLDLNWEFIIADEVQDQPDYLMDMIIKRVSDNSKIVLTGDIDQLHNPRLTRENNGLVYAKKILTGSRLVAQVCFTPEEIVRGSQGSTNHKNFKHPNSSEEPHSLVEMVAKRQAEGENINIWY